MPREPTRSIKNCPIMLAKSLLLLGRCQRDRTYFMIDAEDCIKCKKEGSTAVMPDAPWSGHRKALPAKITVCETSRIPVYSYHIAKKAQAVSEQR